MNAGGAAVAGVGELSLRRPGAHLGGSAGVLLVDSHSINVPTGTVSGWRTGGTGDLLWRVS